MSDSRRSWIALTTTSCLAATALLPAAAAQAAPSSEPAADVQVVRVTKGARTIGPGASLLLGVSLTNQGSAPTSAQNPLLLTFPGLPAEVTLRPAGTGQPGLTCGPATCQYTGAVAPNRLTTIHLVADVAPTLRPGTSVRFEAVAGTPNDSTSAGAAERVQFRIGSQKDTRPRVSLKVDPRTTVAAGRRATLAARLVAVAGTDARRIAIADLVPRRIMTGVEVSGAGWKCARSADLGCRYRRTLAVGEASTPVTITGRMRSRLAGASVLPGSSRRHGGQGDLRWTSTIVTANGDPTTQINSLIAQLRAPRWPTSPRPDPDVPDWTTLTHLEARLQSLGGLRPGGTSAVRLETLYNRVGHTRGTSRVSVQMPKGVRIDHIRSPRWRCRIDTSRSRARCALPDVIRRGSHAPRVTLHVRGTAALKGKDNVRAKATCTWRAKDGIHRDFDATAIRVLDPLRVRAHVSHRGTLASPRGQGPTAKRLVQLHAAIRGTDVRMRPAYRWRQVRGPSVKWRGPRGHAHGHQHVAATFRAPAVRTPVTVAFEITARANGATARDRVSLRLRPNWVAVMASHAAASRKAARHARPPGPVPNRRNWIGTRTRPKIAIKAAGKRTPTVTAGRPFRLRPRVVGAANPRYRWKILAGPKKVAQGRTNRTFFAGKAPANPGLLLVGLRVKAGGGVHASRATVVRVVAPRKSASVAAVDTIQRTEATASGFCSAFAAAADGQLNQPIKLPSGQLTPGAVTTAGTNCSSPKAAISFTAGKLVLGSHTFTAITAELTASGLSITAGTYQPPKSWAQALSFLDNPDLSFRTGSGPAITAAWSGGSLGSLGGSFTVSDFLFLDLPGGWQGSTSFTFTPGSKEPIGLAASAVQGNGAKGGAAGLSGTVALDGTFSLTATAANLVTFTGADGSQATASGSGTIALPTPGGSVAYDVSASLDGPIELLESLTLKSAGITVDNTGVKVAANGVIQAADDAVGLQVSGDYASSNKWDLAVSQTSPWVSADVTVSALTGTLSNSNGVVSFSVSGQAADLNVPQSLTVSQVTAVVTNQCPPTSKTCRAGAVRLAIDVTGTVTVGGVAEVYSGSLQVDLTTMAVSFSAQVSGADFGPDGLQLSDITIGFDSKGNPVPSGTCSGVGADALSFAATVDDVFGADNVAVIGEIDAAGYCFSAVLDEFTPTGNSDVDKNFSGVALIYSSYDTSLAVPGLQQPVAIPAQTAALYGAFTTPASMSRPLGGLSGTGVFHAVLTDTNGGMGFNGGIAYTLTDPLYLTGSASQAEPSLSMSEVALTIAVGAGDFDLALQADGAFFTPAASDGSSQASTMPLSLGVDIDLTSASFGFAATAAGGVPVADAFGESGLTLSNLSIAGSLGASDSLAFAADAELPESWVGSLGVAPDTDIGLVIDISATPCLQFSIGQPSQTTPAINFMNQGALVADYGNVVLAPLGCQFSDVSLPAGFALDFDGLIGGDRIDFNASLDLGVSGFALQASVFLAEFSIGSVELTDTAFALDLDPSQNVFDISFASTVTVGESSLAVSGSYDQNGDSTTATFAMSTPGDISIAGFDFDDATVNFSYTSSPPRSAMSFAMTGFVSFLDQSFDGEVALTTQNGSINSASGNFTIDINVGIASISGPLVFTYEQGEGASGTFGPGNVSAVGIDFFDVSGSLQPSGAYNVQAYTAVPSQNATAADTWLYGNEGGDFTTAFSGTLGINVSGGNGASASVTYGGSSIAVWSEWSTHTWTSYGSWVPIPTAGCPASYVSGNGFAGTPDVNFFLDPYAVENDSTGDPDDDTNTCISFVSQVIP